MSTNQVVPFQRISIGTAPGSPGVAQVPGWLGSAQSTAGSTGMAGDARKAIHIPYV